MVTLAAGLQPCIDKALVIAVLGAGLAALEPLQKQVLVDAALGLARWGRNEGERGWGGPLLSPGWQLSTRCSSRRWSMRPSTCPGIRTRLRRSPALSVVITLRRCVAIFVEGAGHTMRSKHGQPRISVRTLSRLVCEACETLCALLENSNSQGYLCDSAAIALSQKGTEGATGTNLQKSPSRRSCVM